MNTSFKGLRAVLLVAGCMTLCVLLNACAVKSRVLAEPLPSEVSELGWSASAPEGLTLEVDQLILRNSGGSWVRDANWDEYVLTAKNDSQIAIVIEHFDLYSDKLQVPAQSSTSRAELEAQTTTTLRTLKDVGVVAGAGLVPVGLTVAIVGTGGGFVTGAAAGAAVASIVMVPVALVAGTVYVVKRRHRAREDKALIDHALIEKGFSIPVTIASGIQLKKSAFFPVTPAPTRLVVQYAAGGVSRELSLNLPALAGLHMKALPAVDASRNSSGSTR
jgi:hypothetical protein